VVGGEVGRRRPPARQRAFGANHERLVEVKRRWDPGNLFRNNQNIDPDAEAVHAA
jgi:hypothetical protein